MNQEEATFQEFLAGRMKDKNLSIKRLSEATGIAPNHIENMLRGNFEEMPSAPYFRGYLIRLGKVLDFDGTAWWENIKHGGLIKNSGALDALPRNRFMKKTPPKYLWPVVILAVIIVAYLVFELPRVLGKPDLTVTNPPQNPYTTSFNTITLMGTVENADSLYLSNGTASSSEELTIAPDGSWQKTVLLFPIETNTFELSAKKLLGGETDIVEQIVYQPASSSLTLPTSSVNGTATSTTTTFSD